MQENSAENFAIRLKLLIAAQAAPKKLIAERAGIHPVTLSKYLSGKRIPATEELHALASILHVTTEWLLSGRGDAKPVNLDQVIRLSQEPVAGHAVCDDIGIYRVVDFRQMFDALVSRATEDWIMGVVDGLQRDAFAGDAVAQRLISELISCLRARINKLPQKP